MTPNLDLDARCPRHRPRNRALLSTGSLIAAALALAAGGAPAMAQGFNGTITGSNGVIVSGNDITVFNTEAVIDWNATATSAADTNVDFLSAGNTVTFHDIVGSSSGDFTVLNRITPSFGGQAIPATISFSGTVNSQANGGAGGNIWFYSPYGILINGTASFNVGSLLLTTAPVQSTNASGGLQLYLDGTASTQIGLNQAPQAGSSIRVLPGAQLNASSVSGNSSYVALFSPRIEQGGAIRSDAMAALVAGEAGTLTFNNGLVGIDIAVGSSDANGVVHTGSTGGAASANGEVQTVAMVAVPKNTAMTMLLSGSIGYDAAVSAQADGSGIVLYSGSTTQADAAVTDATHVAFSSAAGDQTGNIAIGQNLFNATTFTNTLQALATGTISVDPVYNGVNSPGLVDFRATSTLLAGRAITMTAAAGETIQGGDSLGLFPMLRRTGEDITISVTGDPAGQLAAGQVAIASFLNLNATGAPDFSLGSVPGTGADGKGGNITVSASRGSLSVGVGLNADADGVGSSGDQGGGEGTGGTIDFGVSNGGAIQIGTVSQRGQLVLSASGVGGDSVPVSATTVSAGGLGVGGTVNLHDDGGTLGFGDVYITASGFGGSGAVSAGGATGGKATVRITGQAQTWGGLSIDTTAVGGDLQQTATVLGSATAQANGLTLAVSGTGALTVQNATLDSSAYINAGSTLAHAATGGGLDVLVTAGGRLTVSDALVARANADLPGDPFIGSVVVAPTMTAGRVNVVADGGTISAGAVDLHADARGLAASATAPVVTGGSATLGAANGGRVTLGSFQANAISAEAYGAVGPVAANAQGGTARVYADNGTVAAAPSDGNVRLSVSASALSGGANYQNSPTGTGFNATGGTATVDVLAGSGVISVPSISVYAKGEATQAIAPQGAADLASFSANDVVAIGGNGGTGTGGTARVNLFGGSLTTGAIAVRAYGLGGASDEATSGRFTSGTGVGGTAFISQQGGTLNAAAADIMAAGIGGSYAGFTVNGGLASNGGAATGGTARLFQSGGTATFTGAVTINAAAAGGAGMGTGDGSAAGNGGAASNGAGLAEVLMPLASTGSLAAPSLAVNAGAIGGAGGTAGVSANGAAGAGGAATAGTARISLADGAISVPGAVTARADATGGAGLTTGASAGGTATFLLTDSVNNPATTRNLGSLLLSGSAAGTAGATRFTAQAGRTASALTIAGDLTATATGAVAPAGDGFVGNLGAVPVTVNGNLAITTPRDVTATTLAGGGINAAGTLAIAGRAISFGGTAVLRSVGNASVTATRSIALGGLSSGGTTLLQAFDPVGNTWGAVSVGALSSTGAVTARTGSLSAGSPGALTFTSSFANTGGFAVTTAGALSLDATTAAGNLSLTSTGSAVTASGALSATGNVAIDGLLGVTVPSLSSGGTTLLRAANGAIDVPILLSSGALTVLGRSATVNSTGPLTVTSATTTAGDLVLTAATGNITAASVDATGAVTLTASAGNVGVTSLSATGTVTASGLGVDITSPGSLVFANSAASSGSFAVTTTGNLAVAGVTAANAANLTAGGTVTASGPINAASVSVGAGGNATLAAITASGAVGISSGGSATLNGAVTGSAVTVGASGSATLAGVTATNGLTVNAGTFAAFNGLASGRTIAVNSADIRIAATGRLGQRGTTTTIALANTGAAAGTAIGGAAAASGWSLDSAEALRLFADQSITISVPTNAVNPADVVIGSLAVTYGAGATAQGPGANIGSGGTLAVSTPGRIRVTGALAPVMSGNTDLVQLTAGQRIDVVTDTGSIQLRNGAGALTGTLRMTAPTVRVATASALAALDAITSLSAAAARLDANDGVIAPNGTVAANALVFDVAATTLLIQNAGTDTQFGNRRGFLANSLAINGLNGAQPSFAINGVLNTNGQTLTGLAVDPLVLVNGVAAAAGGSFNQLSTINGCAVGIDCTVPPVTVAPPHDTVDALTAVLATGGDGKLSLPIVQFGQTPLLNSPPLIDEPVTGVGNDDLWLNRCGADKHCTE